MSTRNPAIDPRPGDKLRSANGFVYTVLRVSSGSLTYRVIYPATEETDSCSWLGSVLLSGWKDLAVGMVVEKTA